MLPVEIGGKKRVILLQAHFSELGFSCVIPQVEFIYHLHACLQYQLCVAMVLVAHKSINETTPTATSLEAHPSGETYF